jgi:hypothetical protein
VRIKTEPAGLTVHQLINLAHPLKKTTHPSKIPKRNAKTPRGRYTLGELDSLTRTTAARNCAINPPNLTITQIQRSKNYKREKYKRKP